jgi:hypothetical protein
MFGPFSEGMRDLSVTLTEARSAASALNLVLVPVGVASPAEFPTAFASIKNANVTCMIVLGDSMLRINRKPIVVLQRTANCLPSMRLETLSRRVA